MSAPGPWGWLRPGVEQPRSDAKRMLDNIVAVPVLLVMFAVMVVLDLTGRLK